MANNHLEQLVAEWYEHSGYFVRRNVLVGLRRNGGYECELDVVAFNGSCSIESFRLAERQVIPEHACADNDQRSN